jgi:hypothetical protein
MHNATGTKRATTDILPPVLIILGSGGSAKEERGQARSQLTGCRHDSPSSLGSRRRENERRKKT